MADFWQQRSTSQGKLDLFMKSKIKKINGCTVVELSGFIDHETLPPLRQQLEEIYKNNEASKVVINMRGLNFVGSSGISTFVKSLGVFNRLRMKPSYCGLKSEFQRMFKLFEDRGTFEIVDSEEEAKNSAWRRYEDWQSRTYRSSETH